MILCLSKKANDYFAYCAEIGSGSNNMSAAWDVLTQISEATHEPVGLWLPKRLQPADAGSYAHGVEVSADYSGEIPDGFVLFDLQACEYLVFQGEPYDEAEFGAAIGSAMKLIDAFDPASLGYEYAEDLAPKMQLAPQGRRGYIELRPVIRLG